MIHNYNHVDAGSVSHKMFTFARDRNFYKKIFIGGGGGFKAIPSVFLRISFYFKIM